MQGQNPNPNNIVTFLWSKREHSSVLLILQSLTFSKTEFEMQKKSILLLLKGTGTGDLIWLKMVSLERS